MATAYSTQLASGAPSAVGGLAGGPNLTRSNMVQGHLSIALANFTIPASGAGSANGDVIVLAYMNVTDHIYFIQVFHTGWGAGATLSIGKIDPNNSANTDATHYANAADVSNAGNFAGASANVGEQVGADPAGDLTTGQTPPGYGQVPITIIATIGGANPTAAGTMGAIIFYAGRP